jgi:hypothetical protein
VKSSARLLIGAALALTLAGKLAASVEEPAPDLASAAASTAQFLGRHGYEAEVRRTARAPHLLVTARRGGCRLAVGDYTPYGTFADIYRDLARPIGPLHFAWRGTLHDSAPKLGPLATFYVWRELRRIGVEAPRSPVLAVAASPQCDLAGLPWEEVASFPR